MLGRTADDAAHWLAGATPAWRDAVQVVCIDLCTSSKTEATASKT